MIKNILTITLNPTVDKSSAVDKITPERKLRCEQPKYEPGGGGINVSRGLSRLGISSRALFPSGGRTGKLLEELLEKENVIINPQKVEGETRENFIIVENTTNQQYRFGMPGTEVLETEQEKLFSCIMALSPFPELIVLSGSLPPGIEPEFLRRIVRSTKEKGAKVIVDTSGSALSEVLDEGVFLLKPNIGELARLVGVESLDNESADEAAQELINRGKTEVIMVSMGPQGAYLVTKDRNEHIVAPAVKKLSTVGAGDSMVAGMVSVLAREGSFSEMAKMGVACGTAATMNPGTGLFRKEDAEKLYKWLCRTKH